MEKVKETNHTFYENSSYICVTDFRGDDFRKALPKIQDDLTKREGIYRLAHGSNESLRPYCLDGAINSASRYRGDKLKVEPNEVSPEVDARRADLII